MDFLFFKLHRFIAELGFLLVHPMASLTMTDGSVLYAYVIERDRKRPRAREREQKREQGKEGLQESERSVLQ